MQVSGETPYHLCLELRITNQQGDGVGAAPNKAMKTAADQAFRSASGFLSRTKEERHWQLRPHTSVMVLPVIFTTAELLTTDTPISDADIKTGKVEGLTLGRARWVWFQENLSKRLLPEGLHLEDHEPVGSNTLERFVMRRHTRALVVVNAECTSRSSFNPSRTRSRSIRSESRLGASAPPNGFILQIDRTLLARVRVNGTSWTRAGRSSRQSLAEDQRCDEDTHAHPEQLPTTRETADA